MDEWLARGGDPARLALYRSVVGCTPLADPSGRALVFDNGAIGDFTGGPGLLMRAEGILRERGVAVAVGPLDGNTFFPYRASLGPFDLPPLPLEPSASPEPWRAAGYREEARYTTTWCPNGPQITNGKPLPDGWRMRPVDFDRFDAELAALYRVTLPAFEGAHRYEPIPFPAFAALYAPFRGKVDPDWVILVEDPDGVVQAYLFAFPVPNAFVIKTIAVHPDARGRRISSAFMAEIHRRAEAKGIPGGFHALMWEGSLSQAITAHGGRVVRRYALYSKRL
jgi:GNAT superfamily N-acetyltransferase